MKFNLPLAQEAWAKSIKPATHALAVPSPSRFSPAAFSADAERLQRFEHEARILSTLNHPNLLAIYNVGEHNGVRYLVSEFLEGQSLREIMADGGLSRRRTSDYALEIAKGLGAAHDKGIVHRDLKPDNIFITRDDRVKILHFGLAKYSPIKSGAHESLTATLPAPTTAGTVMGTVGYMSPEQVRGEAVDHRSDIFSFGAVLCEMVSGKRAFRGDSSVETMNAILKEDVPEPSTSPLRPHPVSTASFFAAWKRSPNAASSPQAILLSLSRLSVLLPAFRKRCRPPLQQRKSFHSAGSPPPSWPSGWSWQRC
jgi:serine/threonine protein kinase